MENCSNAIALNLHSNNEIVTYEFNPNDQVHHIDLSPNQEDSYFNSALGIINKFHQHRFECKIVGGWVRDKIIGVPSADIDLATDAKIEDITRIFGDKVNKHVGLPYGIAFIKQDGEEFEVACYRSINGEITNYEEENATIKTDAKRRDFTSNALFYDPTTKKIEDYVNGLEDLSLMIIRTVDDPKITFQDGARLIRAVRLTCKLDGFKIAEDTAQAIQELAKDLFKLTRVSSIVKQLEKLFHGPNLDKGIKMLHNLNLLKTIFPSLSDIQEKEAKKLGKSLSKVPENAPFEAYLFKLLPNADKKDLINLCKRLGLPPKKSKSKINYFMYIKNLVNNSNNLSSYDQVKIFTIENGPLYLTLLGKKDIQVTEEEIEKFEEAKNIVNGKDVMEGLGCNGKEVRTWLEKARRIAFEENLDSIKDIISELKLLYENR